MDDFHAFADFGVPRGGCEADEECPGCAETKWTEADCAERSTHSNNQEEGKKVVRNQQGGHASTLVRLHFQFHLLCVELPTLG